VQERTRTWFRATVHFDGAAFHGWQVQPRQRTVQGSLEDALSRLFDAPARTLAAGRTDRGVHATGQEVAFAAPRRWKAADMRRALNAVVPDEIWIEKLTETSREFHPRYDATARRYEYFLATGPGSDSPLRSGRVWRVDPAPRLDRLAAAAAALVGRHSFEAFAKAGQEERGHECVVESARWSDTRLGDLRFVVVANRFLHHMVRYLVRTQVEIATGRREPGELEALLEGRGGCRAPAPAPPQGLYLSGVRYGTTWNRRAGVPGLTAAEENGDST
jgi:tRNA pseudouridine38-40 synthase